MGCRQPVAVLVVIGTRTNCVLSCCRWSKNDQVTKRQCTCRACGDCSGSNCPDVTTSFDCDQQLFDRTKCRAEFAQGIVELPALLCRIDSFKPGVPRRAGIQGSLTTGRIGKNAGL